MGSYGYRRGSDWESELAGSFLFLVIIMVAILVTLVVVITVELVRIFSARAVRPSPVRRPLWIALGALLGCWLLAGLLMAFAATAAAGVYLASWSTLVFVVGVIVADKYAAQFDAQESDDELALADVLRPWVTGAETAASPVAA